MINVFYWWFCLEMLTRIKNNRILKCRVSLFCFHFNWKAIIERIVLFYCSKRTANSMNLANSMNNKSHQAFLMVITKDFDDIVHCTLKYIPLNWHYVVIYKPKFYLKCYNDYQLKKEWNRLLFGSEKLFLKKNV